MDYDAFISYSHAADGALAPALQRGLQRLARPWHHRRALEVFRDQTGLAVSPALWSSIRAALDESEFFVLLACPQAASSRWVNQEIEHWLARHPVDRLLPVVTSGEWVWDSDRTDFDWERSTAVPAALRGVFREEPRHLDLRWARGEAELDLRHGRFRDAVTELAAPMHGMSKEDLDSEDVVRHRRVLRLRRGVLAVVCVLLLLVAGAGLVAVHNARAAAAAAGEALRQQRVPNSSVIWQQPQRPRPAGSRASPRPRSSAPSKRRRRRAASRASPKPKSSAPTRPRRKPAGSGASPTGRRRGPIAPPPRPTINGLSLTSRSAGPSRPQRRRVGKRRRPARSSGSPSAGD